MEKLSQKQQKSVYLFTVDEFNKISSEVLNAEIRNDSSGWFWVVSGECGLDDNELFEEIGNAIGWDIDNIFVDINNDSVVVTIK